MKFLTNENISSTVIKELRVRGHAVLAVKETMCGAADPTVLARAQLENRILITCDKDFGELAFRARLPASSGIILFRLSGENPDQDNSRMLAVLQTNLEFKGQFIVADENTYEADRCHLRYDAVSSHAPSFTHFSKKYF